MRQLSAARRLDITGYVLPWQAYRNQPLLVVIETETWLPIYSSSKRLKNSLREMKIRGCTIKQIDDGPDFLRSITEQGLRVCLDLRHENGNARFARVALHDAH